MIAYTALWNVTGNPAASVPTGVAADGLPLAVQLVGRHNDETTLLSLSAQVETARPWTMPVLGRERRRELVADPEGAGTPAPGRADGQARGFAAAQPAGGTGRDRDRGLRRGSGRPAPRRSPSAARPSLRGPPAGRARPGGRGDQASGGSAYGYACDLTDARRPRHSSNRCWRNTAGRHAREQRGPFDPRSLEFSYDRMHDFERTMAINYFGPVRLILGLLPRMRERKFGHVVNIVTWGVQMKAPKFTPTSPRRRRWTPSRGSRDGRRGSTTSPSPTCAWTWCAPR